MWPFGEDFGVAVGYENGVLEVGGRFPVLGDDRPAVIKDADTGDAGVDHRLDGEGHGGHEGRGFTARAEVRNMRLLVEFPADFVADEFADDAESEGLRVFGDSSA